DGAYTFTFAAADLGGFTGFNYYVESTAWTVDDVQVASDRAPDDGTWPYFPLTTPTWEGGGAVAALPDGTLYLGGNDSLWHQVDAATLAALGLGNAPVTTYGSLPGHVGEPIAPTAVVTPTPVPVPTPTTAVVPSVVKPVIAKPTTAPVK